MKTAIDEFLKAEGIPDADYAACAGTAMYLHGLREDLKDVDLIVPELEASHAEGMYGGMEVDAHNEWDELGGKPVPGFSNEIMANRVNIEGVWAMDIPSILKFKEVMGRPKDLAHAELIKKYMGQ
jgi:hypothetical protein